jgi:hypothetical protein
MLQVEICSELPGFLLQELVPKSIDSKTMEMRASLFIVLNFDPEKNEILCHV